jgi:coenzyme Q-binding protein COQ10
LRRHTLTKVLPYRPDQLFEMVGDIDRYPEFVPWLTSMRTWNPQELELGVTSVDAEAGIGISVLRERFSTRVIRDPNNTKISVTLLSGPFKALRNEWLFRPHMRGALVEFSIDFEFKSRLLDAFLAANMDRAIDKLIACFEERARVLYGEVQWQSA